MNREEETLAPMGKQTMMSSGDPLHTLKEALERKQICIQEGALSWAADSHPRYPWRQSGKTPYEVLIGELWLKQTTSVVAMRVYHRFLQRFLSAGTLAEATENDFTDVFPSFHLQQHAREIRALVERLLEKGKGKLPGDSQSFITVSGLENHSVRAIMCFGYGLPVAVIDSNVIRMLSRLFGNSLPPRSAQGLLRAVGESLLPCGNHQDYNRGLLDLAALLCRDEDPLCVQCPVAEACDYVGVSL